jgi:hypothetical protein
MGQLGGSGIVRSLGCRVLRLEVEHDPHLGLGRCGSNGFDSESVRQQQMV